MNNPRLTLVVLTAAGFMFLLGCAEAIAQSDKSLLVLDVNEKRLRYVRYLPSNPVDVDLSLVDISTEKSSVRSLKGRWFEDTTDFVDHLLRQGFVQLRNTESSPQKYIVAQDEAKNAKRGLWKPAEPKKPWVSPPNTRSKLKDSLLNIWKTLGEVFGAVWPY